MKYLCTSQNTFPKGILGGVLPSTGTNFPLQDALRIFRRIQILRAGWPLYDFSCLAKTLAKYSVVNLAAWEGALSCMKTMSFRNDKLFFLTTGQGGPSGSQYTVWKSFCLHLRLNCPTSSLSTIAAQNITQPPLCCCLIWWERGPSLQKHRLLHPSGPSRVARHSSASRTFENLISCYFFPIPSSFFCGYSLMEGEPLAFHIFKSSSEYGTQLIWAHQEHQHFQILLF